MCHIYVPGEPSLSICALIRAPDRYLGGLGSNLIEGSDFFFVPCSRNDEHCIFHNEQTAPPKSSPASGTLFQGRSLSLYLRLITIYILITLNRL